MRYLMIQYARQPDGMINEQVSYSKKIKDKVRWSPWHTASY